MPSPDNRDKVDEIKSRLNIVDVIGQDVALRGIGDGQYVGSVPPVGKSGTSLKVDQKAQVWHDMKNGKGGDVFDWIGYHNGLETRGADFPEVLRVAADLAGVELADMTDEEKGSAKEKADIQNLFTEAAGVYHGNLKPEHYDYIKEKWGIDRETVDRLKIGYATTGRNLKGLDETILKKSGLVYANNGRMGGEVFQGRIIFPYWKNGKVVYLIGRETEETPAVEREKGMKYKKLLVHKEGREYVSPSVQNSYFYGEDSLRGAEYCIITEGVTDCIAMLQAGFSCISPVTVQFREQDHPKLISLTERLKRVYICNDNEANQAGLKGALNTAEALESEGIETRLIILPRPEGLKKIDIAEYMKEQSPENFKVLMDASVSLWNYKLNQQVIPTSSTSPERLRAFKVFISNDLHAMTSGEWEVFVNNEVPEKFDLAKKYVKSTVEAVAKERQNDNKTEASEREGEAQGGSPGEQESDPLSKYPQWATEQANDILTNGDPFQYILDVWQKRHVGDTNIGENCLCAFATRTILNCKRGLHIKPSGDSGKGKSDAIECMLDLLPEGTYITGSMSAKALFYDNNLKPGTIVYSDDACFSDDVIATIKQSTSKFQKPTTHRTVVNGEPRNFPIPERVTFLFSSVEGMDDEQLSNRFLHAEVDNSREQDLRVHQHQKDIECWYESDTTEPDILICRCIFDTLFKEFYRVKIPFLELITWNNTENRRNFDKFKDVIRAVTVYNCRKREVFEGFLMAATEDYERALKIYKGTSVNNATNLTDTEIKYLRYIVSAPEKTVTVKMLVNHFKVSEVAVRNMLNGKKGNGGLLAKVKQLVVRDESTTIKTETMSKSTREKHYQYTGEFTGLDLYESIAEINYDAIDSITMRFKAMLYENMTRVTKGNLMGNLSEVTHENNCSKHNNIINNNNITINKEDEGGYFSSSISYGANVQSEEDQEKNNFSQGTSQTEEIGYVEDKFSQQITETTVTYEGYGRLPLVTFVDENGNGIPENGGYPSTDADYIKKSKAEDIHNQGNSGLLQNKESDTKTIGYDTITEGYPHLPEGNHAPGIASLLRKALITYAWSDEYNGVVENVPVFVGKFNERTPEYKGRLGLQAILYNAEKLKERGWR